MNLATVSRNTHIGETGASTGSGRRKDLTFGDGARLNPQRSFCEVLGSDYIVLISMLVISPAC
jgi:hypothetical protein